MRILSRNWVVINPYKEGKYLNQLYLHTNSSALVCIVNSAEISGFLAAVIIINDFRDYI
jgi:hypothetical protein